VESDEWAAVLQWKSENEKKYLMLRHFGLQKEFPHSRFIVSFIARRRAHPGSRSHINPVDNHISKTPAAKNLLGAAGKGTTIRFQWNARKLVVTRPPMEFPSGLPLMTTPR
jgi:hypothetical protein